MYSTMLLLASPGPPCVRTRGSANNWKALIVLITIRNNTVGDSSGRVTGGKRAHARAPSTIGASWYSGGIARSPAMYTRMETPTVFQFLTMIRETGAHADEPSQ